MSKRAANAIVKSLTRINKRQRRHFKQEFKAVMSYTPKIISTIPARPGGLQEYVIAGTAPGVIWDYYLGNVYYKTQDTDVRTRLTKPKDMLGALPDDIQQYVHNQLEDMEKQ